MNEEQMKAVLGLGLTIGLVVVAGRLARTQGAVLGLSPTLAQAVVTAGASIVAKSLA